MPTLVPQELKSPSTIALQPKTLDKGTVQRIMHFDLCGWKHVDISKEVGLCQSRISIIVQSPLYKMEIARRRKELQSTIVDKESTLAVEGDYVQQRIKKYAKQAIDVEGELLVEGKQEVRLSASKDLLDRAGYTPKREVQTTTLSMTTKMADRIEEVIKYDESAKHERHQSITVKKEVST